jgi:hypothetical protein
MTEFTDETGPLERAEPFFLGVIGSRTDVDASKYVDGILTPLLEEWGKLPEKLILPAEGCSSILIGAWAEQLNVPTQIYEADWFRHKRRAKIFRDARIQQESTHFLIFLNKRSTFNEQLAERLARSGKSVCTVSYDSWEVTMLIPSSIPPSVPPTKRESKRGTGTKSKSQQSTQLKDLGSQQQLTTLWAT